MQTSVTPDRPDWPAIRTAGVDGFVISFADRLDEPANRAALAFRAAVDRAGWSGVEETATSLVSTYLRFDLRAADHAVMRKRIAALIAERDWYAAPLPGGRRRWTVPAVFGTDLAPQLDEAASLAGLTPAAAVAALTARPLRVQAIGFAPGQPYLGQLPPEWDLPRQSVLTDRVPEGALVVAIRQVVLFSVGSPTGWRHVGQAALRLFRPEAAEPFVLRPGDEVHFRAVGRQELERMRAAGDDGGAVAEVLG
ncbi:MAG: 5-oxoprolinase subunit B family protein [Gemmobacter sp.]